MINEMPIEATAKNDNPNALVLGYAGTFDLFTEGHAAVVEEARQLASKVIVFISSDPRKSPSMTDDKRKMLIDRVAKARGWDRVETVIVRKDYTARVARRMGVTRMVRGLRNTADFEAENLLQMTNVEVIANIKSIFVIPPLSLGSVSSTFVRGLIADSPVGWHWKVRRFIPQEVYEEVRMNWLRKEWESMWETGFDQMSTQHKSVLEQAFIELTGPTMYGDPTRPYHGLDHLVHGLSEISSYFANNPIAPNGTPYFFDDEKKVKRGFFLHDAFTHARADGVSPEEASARYADKLMLESGNYESIQDVTTLVRMTDHLQSNELRHRLGDVMMGADLAILGQGFGDNADGKDDFVAYRSYAHNVRIEYAQYSDEQYASGRAKVLQHLIDKAKRNELFTNPYFSMLYNDSAVSNMENELRELQGVAIH